VPVLRAEPHATDLVKTPKTATTTPHHNAAPIITAATVILSHPAVSEAKANANIDVFNFQPVCPASDGVFRIGQTMAAGVAGDQTVEDYRPLINDVLIRVRTELCVLESFVRETATPFIAEKGVGWILPLHETSETYVAGIVFMVGANFILLGSTKVVAILAIYLDLLIGLPCRLLGGVFGTLGKGQVAKIEKEIDSVMDEQMKEMRRLMDKSDGDMGSKMEAFNARYAEKLDGLKQKKTEAETSTSSGARASAALRTVAVPLSIYGRASLGIRQGLEVFDTFCSRYFVTFTVGYIIVKTLHFVFFPDFP
jgi:hypothetical protein